MDGRVGPAAADMTNEPQIKKNRREKKKKSIGPPPRSLIGSQRPENGPAKSGENGNEIGGKRSWCMEHHHRFTVDIGWLEGIDPIRRKASTLHNWGQMYWNENKPH